MPLGHLRILHGNRGLSLLVGGQVVSAFGDRLYIIVVLLLAYNLTHSATTVALLNLMRLLPSALFTPLTGALADRFNRKALMVTADLGRAALMLTLLLVTSSRTLWIAFPVIFATTCLLSLFRPALSAILPPVVGDDGKLVQANALMSQIDALAFVLGPALAGILILLGKPQLAFAINAATYLVSAGTLLLLAVPPNIVDARPKDETNWLAETMAGFRFLFLENEKVLGAVTLPFVGYQLFEGAFWALIVVLTVQIWHLGSQGTAFVNVAYGLGGVIGGFLVGVTTTKLRLSSGFGTIIAAQATTVILLAWGPGGPWPFATIGVLGVVDFLILIMGVTIVQMATPRDLLGRSFAAFESTSLFSKVAGSLLAGPAIEVVGARKTATFMGVFTLCLLVLCLPHLRRLEPVLGTRLFLRRVPILATLSRATLDDVAMRVQLEHVPPDTVIVRQGELGDKLYIVKHGTVEILVCDERGREVTLATSSDTDFFGEIALLHNVPRTATVISTSSVDLYSLSRVDFQALMERSPEFHEAVDTTAEQNMLNTQTTLLMLR